MERIVLFVLVIIVVIFMALFFFRRRPDTFNVKFAPDPIRDNEAGARLRDFLVIMNRVGDDAESAYEAALAVLRARAEEVIAEIAHAERAVSRDSYPKRWALVYTAAALKHPAALPFLKDVTLRDISPEQSKDIHLSSSVREETIIRTTAVEGVEHLAVGGNKDALDALFEFLKQPSISIRCAAVLGIFATDGGESLRPQVAALLPAEQRFLLNVKRVRLSDVSVVTNPERTLAKGARPSSGKPLPGLSVDFAAPRVRRDRPAPTIGKEK